MRVSDDNIIGMKRENTEKNAINIFKKHSGMLRTAQAIRLGIHCETLYKLRDQGVLETVARGLYRLSSFPELSHPDIVTVALKIPHGVICLISALEFHEITTHIPHKVYVALERGSMTPRLKYPPLSVVRYSGEAFSIGIETHKVDDVDVRIYSAAKTVADCFKSRNRLGLDVAIEALKLALSRKRATRAEIFRCAKICGVERIIRPYIEALQ